MHEQTIRQKLSPGLQKFIVLMPVTLFPCIAILLWAVGIVGTRGSQAAKNYASLNPNLPNAINDKDSNWDKLKFYEKADTDSAKYKSLLNDDPYFNLITKRNDQTNSDTSSNSKDLLSANNRLKFKYDPEPNNMANQPDPNEEMVYEKLNKLNQVLEQQAKNKRNEQIQAVADDAQTISGDESVSIDEKRIKNIQELNTSGDPEMKQINGMLEKILDIQHPERVEEKIKKSNQPSEDESFNVYEDKGKKLISLLSKKQITQPITDTGSNENLNQQFYSLKSDENNPDLANTISAIIDESQTVTSGSTIKLRFLTDVIINGNIVKKEIPVYGKGEINGDRLLIQIKFIRQDSKIFPVKISVFDLDGMEGIYIPGSITRESAKENTERAIQALNVATLDPSVGAQAASAGIQAAKSLIGKKTKLIRVTIKPGYRLYLKRATGD
jgi:conjugative transposon TraM protein